jgi:hypothetical protein
VPGDVHDVVDAAEQPDRAVVVVLGAVAREVVALLLEARPVGLAVALLVAPDAAQHRRPRLVQHEVAAPARADRLGSSVTTSALIPGSVRIAEPGLHSVTPGSGEIMIAPVSVCHQVSTIGQLLRPMFSRYHIQASGLIGSPTLPSTRSEEQVVLLRDLLAPLHERADQRGRV